MRGEVGEGNLGLGVSEGKREQFILVHNFPGSFLKAKMYVTSQKKIYKTKKFKKIKIQQAQEIGPDVTTKHLIPISFGLKIKKYEKDNSAGMLRVPFLFIFFLDGRFVPENMFRLA